VKGGLLLDVVVRKSAAILKLLASEDQALLVGWDAFLVLDLRLNVVDRVRRFNLEGDSLAGESLDEDLHTTTETENKVEGRLLLNVVVRKSATVLELLAGENETLLVGRDTFLVLDLRLHVVDGVGRLDLQSDGLTREGLDEDLHTTTETEDEMESRLLLNVVVRKSATVLKLLAGEDETLLVGRNTFLVLDLGLDVVDGVRRLHLKGDGLAREGLDEDLHTSTKTEDEMEGGFLLDVVIRKSAPVLELFTGKDQTLLIGRDALFVLDLGLDIVDSIRGLDLKSDGLASKGLYEDLHGDGVR